MMISESSCPSAFSLPGLVRLFSNTHLTFRLTNLSLCLFDFLYWDVQGLLGGGKEFRISDLELGIANLGGVSIWQERLLDQRQAEGSRWQKRLEGLWSYAKFLRTNMKTLRFDPL